MYSPAYDYPPILALPGGVISTCQRGSDVMAKLPGHDCLLPVVWPSIPQLIRNPPVPRRPRDDSWSGATHIAAQIIRLRHGTDRRMLPGTVPNPSPAERGASSWMG